MQNELLLNIEKLHTTPMGEGRIRRNLGIDAPDIVSFCADKIKSVNSKVTRKGKNFYIEVDRCLLTVNAHSYTIITAHKIKAK